MAKEGAVILGAGRRQAPLLAMAEQVQQLGGQSYIATMDIADYDMSKQAIDALAAEAGGIDILVHCAAIFEEHFSRT